MKGSGLLDSFLMCWIVKTTRWKEPSTPFQADAIALMLLPRQHSERWMSGRPTAEPSSFPNMGTCFNVLRQVHL